MVNRSWVEWGMDVETKSIEDPRPNPLPGYRQRELNAPSRGSPGEGWGAGLSSVVNVIFWPLVLALNLAPHALRLRHPSLLTDDVLRLTDFQTTPLRQVLLKPFAEHVHPLFQLVNAACWELAAHRLDRTPLILTVAALIPFLGCVLLMGALIRRETHSTAAAILGASALNLSTLTLETAWFFSGSTFAWSLLATLTMLWGCGRPGRLGLGAILLGAAAAPACSTIGLLAGPVGTLDVWLRPGRKSIARRLAPMLGLAMFVVGVGPAEYRAVLAGGANRFADVRVGLLTAARAPSAVLLPGLLGVEDLDRRTPIGWQLALSAVAGSAALALAARRSARPWAVGGLALIVGGYLLTYPVRALTGADSLLRLQRFHLFPNAGLILILAVGLAPLARRLDAHRALILLILVTLLAVHWRSFERGAAVYDHPDQRRTLDAIDRLGETCRRIGITREQALRALDPIQNHWQYMPGHNALAMMPEGAASPRLPDGQVRRALIEKLSPPDREALFGNMDVGPYLGPTAMLDGPSRAEVGVLVSSVGLTPLPGTQGRFAAEGWPAHREYAFRPGAARLARWLCLRADDPAGGIEVWWASPGQRWSELRSVRWRPDPSRAPRDWALRLDALPHWDAAHGSRVRIYFRFPDNIELSSPRYLR